MFRKTGLRQLAFVTALSINLIAFFLAFVFGLLSENELGFTLLVLTGSILLTSFVAHYIIVEVVYNKVKPLYKIIKKAKIPSSISQKGYISDDVLDKVEQDVNKWAQETSKEMESLKTLENYRKDYIGNVSHELKTPIFNIQGFVHTLLDGAMYEKKYLNNYLEKTAINVERLITIVEDLDTISKLESGALTFEIEKFQLNDLVAETIDELKELSKEKNIKVFIKEGVNKSFKVKADKNSIRQVLTNLIANSIKYGKEGGETKIGFYDMHSYILVEVTDNGIGIEEKHLNHVFDRFYRVDKSRSRVKDVVGGGSGLGLAIVKHLIEAHDQTISVRSTPGVGSTFGFTLEKA
ncbi:MAG: HAMP domain-containing sensor histidine kinase [Saprospiraceae bacterium]|nr:HAMP domain-containing sensor histidine kinase [Saprospiraceae bacterium]